ncbi:MAG: hypothetical protein ACXVKP_20590 [Ilumatobacteraceae bacterium]
MADQVELGSGQCDDVEWRRTTGLQKIVVRFSSTAAAVVTPDSIVCMIVSATTDGGHAVASGTGHLGGVGEAQV